MSTKYKEFSETDTAHKIIVPYLENLGFKKSEMEFEYPIKAQIGSKKAKTVFADIVIKQKGKAVMVVEIKKTDHRLEKRDREQAISYARLFDPEPVNFAVVTNGHIWQTYNVKTKERIPKVPSKNTLFRDISKFKLTDSQRDEANYFVVEGYETVQDIENALRKCHNTLYANDGLTPLQTFEEINKFLFSKIQEEKRTKKTGDQNRFTTKYIETRNKKVEMQRIFEDAINDFPNDVEKIFFQGDKIEVCDESILQVVKVLENKGFTETDIDIVGMAYETFLKPIFRNKHLGQYFTPREVVNFMVEFVKPQVGDLIIDPAFGSGGFLVEAFQVLKEKIANSGFQPKIKKDYIKKLCRDWIFGTEIAPHLAKACKINMYIHGDGKTGVYKQDGLVNYGEIKEDKFNLVLTNPPFGGVVNKEDLLESFELGKGHKRQLKEVLFLERCINLAKAGGTIGIVLPDGILTNSSLQYVRDFILDKCKIIGVISLPNHAFATSGAGVKTSIMFLQKKEEGKDYSNYDIFMAEAEHVGYDATGRLDDNDFGDILDKYYDFRANKGSVSEKIFFLKKSKIEGRLDVRFYDPYFQKIAEKLKTSKYSLEYIDNIAKVTCGPFGSAITNKDYVKEGIPLIRIANLRDGTVSDKLIFIKKALSEKLKGTQVRQGDIVISQRGTLGAIAKIPSTFPVWNISANLISLSRIKANINYVYVILNSPLIKQAILRKQTGQVHAKITTQDVKSLEIPLPPAKIQEKIVKEFQEYQGDILSFENEIQELKQVREKYLEKSLGFEIMENKKEQSFELNIQRFSGTRFDPNYYQSEYRGVKEILKNGRYSLQKIGEIFDIKKGVEVGSRKYTKQGIPFVRVSDIESQGINFETNKRISEKTFSEFKNHQPEDGELLFAKDGSIGICVLVNKKTPPFIISGAILRLSSKKIANHDFLRSLINSKTIQSMFKRESTGAVIKHLLVDKFKNIEIPFPPIDKQNEIAEQIKEYEDEIINLRKKINKEREGQSKVLDILF